MMSQKLGSFWRWALLIASGGLVLQTASCVDYVQTGILAFLAGTTFYLARNV
jgi:hypothetical protein